MAWEVMKSRRREREIEIEREREREEEVCSQTHCCANINHVDSHKIIRADHSQSGSLCTAAQH